MEHETQYVVGRYHAVEQFEKVKHGYEWQVMAYDDTIARELPWNPPPSFGSTLAEWRRRWKTLAALMRRETIQPE